MIKFVGDIHGDILFLHSINLDGVSAIVQVGDFGFYPAYIDNWKPLPIPVYAIDGNHEHFPWLAQFMNENEPVEIRKNLFYVPRGCVFELDGHRIAAMGGAASVDYKYRKLGVSWFEEEQITNEQFKKLDNVDADSIDILLTHTPPQSTITKFFNPMDLVNYFGLSLDWFDPSARKVELLYRKFHKAHLICGHMHRTIQDERVTILDINQVIEIPSK